MSATITGGVVVAEPRRSTGGVAVLRRTISAAVFAALAVAIATAAAWPIHAVPRAVLVGVVAGVVGIALGILSARLARGGLVAEIGLPVAYAALVVPLAVPSATSSPAAWLLGIRDGFTGLVLGWKQLLTLELPVGEYQAVLVPLFAVVLLGGFAVAALAARPDRLALLSVPVALAMTAFGVLFGAPAAGPALELGPVVIPGAALVLLSLGCVVLCLAWLALRARLARAAAIERAAHATAPHGRATGPRVGRGLLATALVVVAVVVGIAVAPAAALVGDRTVLRDRVDPMLVLSRVESPLTSYRSSFAGDSLTERLLTVTGAGGLDRLRIATLTEFDGVRFVVDPSDRGRFTRLPSASRAPGDVEVTIALGEGWSGPWLPLPGILTSAPAFSGEDAAALADGLAVAPGGLTAIAVTGASAAEAVGPAPGTVYTVAGLPVPDAAEVLAGAAGGAPGIDEEAYPSMAAWVALQELPRTGDGLLALVDRLRERGMLSHARAADAAAEGWIAALQARADYVFESSLAGHTTARIEDLFAQLVRQQQLAGPDADPALLVSGVGDEEQFATAVALLARMSGFESRVVVGLRLTTDEPLSSVAPCDAGVCTGASLTAWVEVLGPDGRWGAIDVGPQFAQPITRVAEGEIMPEHPTTPRREESALLAPPVTQLGDSSRGGDEPPAEGPDWLAGILPIARVVGLIVLGLILLVLPAIVLAVAKAGRRTSRRRAAHPEAAVVGAWEELVDAYVDHRMIAGDRGPRSRTAERTGREAATRLAGTVDAAVFSDSPVTEADRAAAWSIVDAERRSLTRGAGLGARLRAALVPRSFLRHLGRESAEPATLAVVRDHAGPGIPDVGSAAIEDAALEQAGIDGAAGADEART